MSKIKAYRDFIDNVRSSLGFWKSYSLSQFTVSLTRLMRLEKVSGKKLASRLGVSPTQVSKVLRGNENVTVETMAKFAAALDGVVHIHVAKRGVSVRWVEVPAVQQVVVPVEMNVEFEKTSTIHAVALPPVGVSHYLAVH